MFERFISTVNNTPYFHPLFIILALLLGSWLPSVARILNNLSRSLGTILRRI